jgi:hypothetical protein
MTKQQLLYFQWTNSFEKWNLFVRFQAILSVCTVKWGEEEKQEDEEGRSSKGKEEEEDENGYKKKEEKKIVFPIFILTNKTG